MALLPIKIPEKHYVGLLKRNSSNIPIGFITPWGEDPASRKRMSTVDNWAMQGQNVMQSITMDNVPMSGFRLTSHIRTTDYGGADKWRIEDPRGFELEISSGNLAQLMTVGTIDKGEILDRCVWARQAQSNVLLSTSTTEYQDAVKATEIAQKKVNWRHVKIGNTVVLQNSTKGKYLGKFLVMVFDPYVSLTNPDLNRIVLQPKVLFALFDEQTNEIHLIGAPKASSIEDSDTISAKDGEELANQVLQNGAKIVGNGYPWNRVIALCSAEGGKILPSYSLKLHPIFDSRDDYKPYKLVLAEIDSMFGEYCVNNRQAVSLHHLNRQDIDNSSLRAVCEKSVNHYHRHTDRYTQKITQIDPANVDQWYHLYINIKTVLGNTISNRV